MSAQQKKWWFVQWVIVLPALVVVPASLVGVVALAHRAPFASGPVVGGVVLVGFAAAVALHALGSISSVAIARGSVLVRSPLRTVRHDLARTYVALVDRRGRSGRGSTELVLVEGVTQTCAASFVSRGQGEGARRALAAALREARARLPSPIADYRAASVDPRPATDAMQDELDEAADRFAAVVESAAREAKAKQPNYVRFALCMGGALLLLYGIATALAIAASRGAFRGAP